MQIYYRLFIRHFSEQYERQINQLDDIVRGFNDEVDRAQAAVSEVYDREV